MPNRCGDLRLLYSWPSTESTLPTKIEVLPSWVGIHSSCARSTSNESPRLKLLPARGVKLTLDENSALDPSPALTLRLSSLTRNVSLPSECTESNRLTPGASPSAATSPRELTWVASRSP